MKAVAVPYIIAIILGVAVGYVVRTVHSSRSARSIEAKAHLALEEARVRARELAVEAKDKAAALLEEFKKELFI